MSLALAQFGLWSLAATLGLVVAQLTLAAPAVLIDQEHNDTCYYVRIVEINSWSNIVLLLYSPFQRSGLRIFNGISGNNDAFKQKTRTCSAALGLFANFRSMSQKYDLANQCRLWLYEIK